MDAIAIETATNAAAVYRRLQFEYAALGTETGPVTIERIERPAQVSFVCTLVDHPRSDSHRDSFVRCTANAISDLIVNEWEGRELLRILKAKYNYFSDGENEAICQHAREHLAGGGESGAPLAYKVRQKERAMPVLLDFLQTEQKVHIDGFIAFRLPHYRQELGEAIDAAVDDFFLEREYSEFIRLLRYFVSIQDTKAAEVHVVMAASGIFQLYDGSRETIEFECPDDEDDPGGDGINYEDLLISALISLAPQKITLHTGGAELPREMAETIRDVFGARVSTCPACAFCRPLLVEGAAAGQTKNKV